MHIVLKNVTRFKTIMHEFSKGETIDIKEKLTLIPCVIESVWASFESDPWEPRKEYNACKIMSAHA